MNIEWFNRFLETSRLKSLSKASEKLNITQPALSKQIRNLEESLGVELFKRTSFGVELTEAGTLLKERIQPVLAEIDSIRNDLVNLNQFSTIRLGALPSLAAFYLPHKLMELSRQGIQVDLNVYSTTGEIVALLKNKALDAGIIQKNNALPKSYWTSDLFHEPFYAIIPETHDLYHRESVTLAQLKDEALIVYPNQCDVRASIIEAYQMKSFEPHFSVEVSFGESIPGFVAAGAGISILPRIIAEHLSHSSLKAIPITDFGKTRTISVVSPNRALGKQLKRFF